MLPCAPSAMVAPLLHNSRRGYLSPQLKKAAKQKNSRSSLNRLPTAAADPPRSAAFFATSTRRVTNATDDGTPQSTVPHSQHPISEPVTANLSKDEDDANRPSTTAARGDLISNDSLRTIYLNSPSFISSQTTLVDFLKAVFVKSINLATKTSIKATENVTKEELTAWNQHILKTFPTFSSTSSVDTSNLSSTFHSPPSPSNISRESLKNNSTQSSQFLQDPNELTFSDFFRGKYSFSPLLSQSARTSHLSNPSQAGLIVPPPLSPTEISMGFLPLHPELVRNELEKYMVTFYSKQPLATTDADVNDTSTNPHVISSTKNLRQLITSLVTPSARTRLITQTQIQTFFRLILHPLAQLLEALIPSNPTTSVHPSFYPYSSLQFIANIFGSAAGVVSTQAMLTAIGLSSTAALPTAAALNWIMKDAIGQIGGSLYATTLSTQFDLDPKHQRVLGTSLYSFSSLLEVLTPLFPRSFLFLAAAGNVGKNVSWMSISATKAAAHMAFMRGSRNLADITVKASAQATAAGVIGTSLGASLSLLYIGKDSVVENTLNAAAAVSSSVGVSDVTILSTLLSSSPLLSAFFSSSFLAPLCLFTVLSVLQVVSVHRSMAHVHINTLNKQRMAILLSQLSQISQSARVSSQDVLGVTVSQKTLSKTFSFPSLSVEQTSLQERYLRKFFGNNPFLVRINSNGNAFIKDSNQLGRLTNLALGGVVANILLFFTEIATRVDKIQVEAHQKIKSAKSTAKNTMIRAVPRSLRNYFGFDAEKGIATNSPKNMVYDNVVAPVVISSTLDMLKAAIHRHIGELPSAIANQQLLVQAEASAGTEAFSKGNNDQDVDVSAKVAELIRILVPEPCDISRVVEFSSLHKLPYYINLTFDSQVASSRVEKELEEKKKTENNLADSPFWLCDVLVRSLCEGFERDNSYPSLEEPVSTLFPLPALEGSFDYLFKGKGSRVRALSTLEKKSEMDVGEMSTSSPFLFRVLKTLKQDLIQLFKLRICDFRIWSTTPRAVFQITTAYKSGTRVEDEILAYAHAHAAEKILAYDATMLYTIQQMKKSTGIGSHETFEAEDVETYIKRFVPALQSQIRTRMNLLRQNKSNEYSQLVIHQAYDRLTGLIEALQQNSAMTHMMQELSKEQILAQILKSNGWDLKTVHLADSKARINLDAFLVDSSVAKKRSDSQRRRQE